MRVFAGWVLFVIRIIGVLGFLSQKRPRRMMGSWDWIDREAHQTPDPPTMEGIAVVRGYDCYVLQIEGLYSLGRIEEDVTS